MAKFAGASNIRHLFPGQYPQPADEAVEEGVHVGGFGGPPRLPSKRTPISLGAIRLAGAASMRVSVSIRKSRTRAVHSHSGSSCRGICADFARKSGRVTVGYDVTNAPQKGYSMFQPKFGE